MENDPRKTLIGWTRKPRFSPSDGCTENLHCGQTNVLSCLRFDAIFTIINCYLMLISQT